MARGSVEHVEGLIELRRDLRALGKDAGREFDREARAIAAKVRDHARGDTPVGETGRTARSITVSSTYRGIAVRSGKVNFPGIEHGTQVWLRRGLPYPKGAAGKTSAVTARGSVPVRQVPAPPGPGGQARVVDEARYLIPRRRPINTAATIYAPILREEAERMIARLQSRYRLGS